MMTERGKCDEFSLLGGPLHRFGCRVGLVRGRTNTVPFGLALGLIPWGVLVVLAAAGGVTQQLFSLATIAAHVRLLVVIPLFFLCESVVDPRMAAFVSTIVRAGTVPEGELPALDRAVRSVAVLRDRWWADALCLLLAVLATLVAPQLQLTGAVEMRGVIRAAAAAPSTLTDLWYWTVCLTLFRFLLLRWIWRLGLWWYFLWRLAHIPLNLVPTHPDRAAGLGYLEIVQAHFTPLIFAFSAIQSASLAAELSTGEIAVEAVYRALVPVVAVDALLFVGPLLVVTSKLWRCRIHGLSDYSVFASRYVDSFERKWLHAREPVPEPLLGTPDLQSLADLNSTVGIVQNMRFTPLSLRLLTGFVLAALLPLLPLYLFEYPVAELAQKFFMRLTGL